MQGSGQIIIIHKPEIRPAMGMIPLTNHEFQGSENSEVVMKFTQIDG